MQSTPLIKGFFDTRTHTVSYVVSDTTTKRAAIIDSVLDYDPASGTTFTASADLLVAYIQEHNLSVDWILETHAHADHLSAAPYLKNLFGGLIAIGKNIALVQDVFSTVFNMDCAPKTMLSDFDQLWNDGDVFHIGTLEVEVLYTPGHTPADVSYRIGDNIFVGDTLFMPDYGSARCDFPGGNAETLYQSVQRIFSLPNETRVFLCHDYLPEGRSLYIWETTIGEQKKQNIHLHTGITKEEFVAMRTMRDQSLGMPALIIPSLQVNIRGGKLPKAEENGVIYLKTPLNSVFSKK
jgi:glyoxylase-like metal-dependent hydrolase (beta-lactamase superfamily II)